jgi:Tfp pilus assembly protein FimT
MKKNDLSELEHITKQLKIAKKTAIKVGLPSDVGSYKNGTSILQVGSAHEYGLGVPRRSFIRVPMDKEKAKIKSALESGFKSVMNGGDVIQNLNKVGLIAQNISQTAFKNQGYGQWQDISEDTKEKKGSSKILFDTGRLVQSVSFWVVKA